MFICAYLCMRERHRESPLSVPPENPVTMGFCFPDTFDVLEYIFL